MALSKADRVGRPHWVYFLRCPETNRVKYIGKTTNLREREAAHRRSHTSKAKADWVAGLEALGKSFLFDAILGPVDGNEAYRVENYLIVRHLIDYPGVLVNGTSRLSFRFNRRNGLEVVALN